MVSTVGCGNYQNMGADSLPPMQPTKYPVTVVDQTGERIKLDAKPVRIVSLIPSTTEIAFALGLGNKVVGVTSNDNYPNSVLKLPKVGDFNINIEKLISLKPDLILAHVSNNKDAVVKLRKLGFNVLVTDAKCIKDIYKSIALVGRACDKMNDVEKLIAHLEQQKLKIFSKAVISKKNSKKMIKVWFEADENLFSGGKGTFINELIELAGGYNITRSYAGWVKLGPEYVLRENPDVIINAYNGKENITNRAGWDSVSAVKSGRVVNIDPDIISRPGPRIIEALSTISIILHGESG